MITGAELKVTLQGLGLPPSWFAEHLNVTMRTVVRWFDSDEVSELVARELQRQVEMADNAVHNLTENSIADCTGMYTLYTYRTDTECPNHLKVASWHRAVVFRAVDRLTRRGNAVRIEYVKP